MQWPKASPLWTALAAFHPIVFLYGGAVRWYAFAFLADALRAWALWGPDPRGKKARGAFVAGALLGAMSGYGELVLVAIDTGWLLVSARSARDLSTRALLAFAAGALALATIALSPLEGHASLVLFALTSARAPRGSLAPFITWASLGPLGEALLPAPWTALAALAIPGLALAGRKALGVSGARPFALWIASASCGWCFLTSRGVVHPRYSLEVWYLGTASLGLLLAGSGASRLAARITVAYLVMALVLTVDQRSFPMADMNRMASADCAALIAVPPPSLVVTSYARTRDELERTCHSHASVVSAAFIRHYQDAASGTELEPIRLALHGEQAVDFVHVNVRGTSLATTNQHMHDLLAARCTLVSTTTAGLAPHGWLKRLVQPESAIWRYTSERWLCPR